MKNIQKRPISPQSVTIPGSKSISHRMLICASLANGTSQIANLLHSEDITLTMGALQKMGADIQSTGENNFNVTGFNGRPQPSDQTIYLGNSGTSMRLLAGIAALGNTPYILTGNERMCERPMKELLDALAFLNIDAKSANKEGTPPVTITGTSRKGGTTEIDCSKSSQYLSSLLMMGALMENGLDIKLSGPPVSSPYIDLTIDIMKKFNVTAERLDITHFQVPPSQQYVPGQFFVEPDLSNAGYFWAVGAITKQMIYVNNISENSLQGDLKQIQILEKMGCTVSIEDNRIGVCGNDLNAVDVDMGDTPDAVPAIAVVASFANGTTRITNIHHLREKECDRIDAVTSQLMKLGITVEQGPDYLCVTGGMHKGATIETFNDHRIAMAFSLPGLMVDGVTIENPSCVEKSFPNYWQIFENLK